MLSAYLREMASAEFEWGTCDCATFASGAVYVMTGTDPMQAYRGHYSSKKEAGEALRELGRGTFKKTLDGMFRRIPIGFAGRGDLAYYKYAVGVVVDNCALFIGQEGDVDGLVRIPRQEWTGAWRV